MLGDIFLGRCCLSATPFPCMFLPQLLESDLSSLRCFCVSLPTFCSACAFIPHLLSQCAYLFFCVCLHSTAFESMCLLFVLRVPSFHSFWVSLPTFCSACAFIAQLSSQCAYFLICVCLHSTAFETMCLPFVLIVPSFHSF